MADRLIPTSATPGEVTGDDFMDAAQDEITGLWNAAKIFLSNIGGTANAITADIDPALTDGLQHGMGFYLKPTANNTGAVTLNSVAVVDKNGDALAADDLVADRVTELVYDGGVSKFVALTEVGAPAAVPTTFVDIQDFTASGTWTRPARATASSMTKIWGWGAGGGGNSSGGGGGGGAYKERWIATLSLGSTETVTIPAGGSVGNAGGNATFGSWLTAYGGGTSSGSAGGGGGGLTSAGSNGVSTTGGAGGLPKFGAADGGAGSGTLGAGNCGGGGGGSGSNANGGYAAPFGGGGGGGGNNNKGGDAVWGGGGGGSSGGSGVGGTSIFGGNGGGTGVAGSVPGGGGGSNAAGGRGEMHAMTIL